MRVVSVCDGISTGRLALERAGIPVTNYIASEINKYSEVISNKNYPDIERVGDLTKIDSNSLGKVDLLIGGTPCQGFSIAGDRLEFKDPRSKLVLDFINLKNKTNPKYFLLENVKMSQECQDTISKMLGTKPIKINSRLVSAQNRERLYWTNICEDLFIEDLGLNLEDIIDNSLPYIEDYSKYSHRYTKNYVQFDVSGKGYNSQQDRAYYIDTKFGTFPNARAVTKRKITDRSGKYRHLTLNECESLQNLPPNYTLLPESSFSLNKSLSCIGDGWTTDIIVEFFKLLKI